MSVASKQQLKKNISGRSVHKFSNSSLLPECIALNQSAVRHFLPEDVTPLSRPHFCMDSSELSKPIQCSDRKLFEVGGVLFNNWQHPII